MSNNPPHVVLELDKKEAEWLHHALVRLEAGAKANFREIAGMSSRDPRAVMRSTLMMAANVDEAIADGLATRIEKQDASLERLSED